MSNLFVSTGWKKLKLHDSAVMFEQGVWFSVLIMLPRARPPDTEITIRFFMPSVDSQVDSHINRHMHKHGCFKTPTHKTQEDKTKAGVHIGLVTHPQEGVPHTHIHPLSFFLTDLSALIWEKLFSVMKQTETMIFLFISGESRPWPHSSW